LTVSPPIRLLFALFSPFCNPLVILVTVYHDFLPFGERRLFDAYFFSDRFSYECYNTAADLTNRRAKA